MCKPASGILTKDAVFFSEIGDSHEQVIDEHKLNADGARGPNIVRFEITPPDGNYSLPLDQWVYRVDQDVMPEWYDAARDKPRALAMLPAWAAAHIVDSGEHKCGAGRSLVAIGTARVVQSGGECRAHGSAQVTQSGGECWAYDTAQVTLAGGVCRAYGRAQVTQSGGECRAYDNAEIIKAKGDL